MMAELINLNFIRDFFTKGNERTLRAKKNVTVSFICKAFSILISFLIVPLTLGYVGKVEYGIWITISAIIQWFTFFDIGLGNGLRNKLAESLALGDLELARIYTSSVFALITMIAFILFIGFFFVANFISWNSVLNTNVISNKSLSTIVIMVFFFFCIGFVLGLVSSILEARQQWALNDILGLAAQLFGLLALYILIKFTKGSLFYLCLVYGSKSAVVMFIAAIFLFLGPLKQFRPSIKYIQFRKAIPLINLGIKFFIGQILYLIVTQTSVILVIQFFGPEDVTTFNLAVRYVSITSMGYMMVLTPFLSAFTEAFTKNDYSWIRNIIKKINWIWVLTSLATLIMVFCYKIFFKLWVGDKVIVPGSLIIALSVSSIISMWSGTFTLFLNGIGKIQLQLYLLGLQAILFFPLSYLFYRLQFGLISIVAAQILFYVSSAGLFTIQYNRIIHKTAHGIWLK
jgi:O-antigen/teichoic acid export membrane protein